MWSKISGKIGRSRVLTKMKIRQPLHLLIILLILQMSSLLGCARFTPALMPPEEQAPVGSFKAASPQAALRLGDRTYIASVLRNFFGGSPEVETILETEILEKNTTFGGPCDPYEVAGEYDACLTDSANAQAPMYSAPSVLRQAYRIRACDRLIQTPSAFDFALHQLYAGAPITRPDADHIRAAFERFNIGRELPSGALSTLLRLVRKNDTERTSWTYVLTVICHDPSWEIP